MSHDPLMPRPFADGPMTATSDKKNGAIMIKKDCLKVLVNGLDKVLDKAPTKKIIMPGTMKELP